MMTEHFGQSRHTDTTEADTHLCYTNISSAFALVLDVGLE